MYYKNLLSMQVQNSQWVSNRRIHNWSSNPMLVIQTICNSPWSLSKFQWSEKFNCQSSCNSIVLIFFHWHQHEGQYYRCNHCFNSLAMQDLLQIDSFVSNEHTIIKGPAMDMTSADSLVSIIAKVVSVILMHEED